MECCSKSVASLTSTAIDKNQELGGDQIPPIKCSLCRCSTPRGFEPIQSGDVKDNDNDPQNNDDANSQSTENSIVSTVTSSSSGQNDNYSRFIVRIFANPK